MPLPEQIPLRYTEEDAGYMSVRPVVKQTFRLPELVDMVVSVAGKALARVQQIFRGGTVVYNGYRYWWDALPAEREEIERLLLGFPEDDPSRPFEPEQATAILLEIGGGAQRTVVEISRHDAAEKKTVRQALSLGCPHSLRLRQNRPLRKIRPRPPRRP